MRFANPQSDLYNSFIQIFFLTFFRFRFDLEFLIKFVKNERNRKKKNLEEEPTNMLNRDHHVCQCTMGHWCGCPCRQCDSSPPQINISDFRP